MSEEFEPEKMRDALTAVLDALPVGVNHGGRFRVAQGAFDYSMVNCRDLKDDKWMFLFGVHAEELLATISMFPASANIQSSDQAYLAVKRDGTVLVHDLARYLERFGLTKEQVVDAVIASY